MKFVVICPDGGADWPIASLGNKTPLEAGNLPNLARLAAEGTVGRAMHVPPNMDNGSDICCMSLLGFDPARYHTGRAPLVAWMKRSRPLFASHPVNRARIKAGDSPATQAWLWGHGSRPALPPFKETFGVSGAMISAVDLLRSLALYLGLEVLNVPGITGY